MLMTDSENSIRKSATATTPSRLFGRKEKDGKKILSTPKAQDKRMTTPSNKSQYQSNSAIATAANKFSRLKNLMKVQRSLDPNSILQVTRNHSESFRTWKRYQKVVYLLLEKPNNSKLGKGILIAILSGIALNVGEAILVSPDKIINSGIMLSVLDLMVLIMFSLELAFRLLSATAFGEQMGNVLLRPIFLVDLIAIIPKYNNCSFGSKRRRLSE